MDAGANAVTEELERLQRLLEETRTRYSVNPQ